MIYEIHYFGHGTYSKELKRMEKVRQEMKDLFKNVILFKLVFSAQTTAHCLRSAAYRLGFKIWQETLLTKPNKGDVENIKECGKNTKMQRSHSMFLLNCGGIRSRIDSICRDEKSIGFYALEVPSFLNTNTHILTKILAEFHFEYSKIVPKRNFYKMSEWVFDWDPFQMFLPSFVNDIHLTFASVRTYTQLCLSFTSAS